MPLPCIGRKFRAKPSYPAVFCLILAGKGETSRDFEVYAPQKALVRNVLLGGEREWPVRDNDCGRRKNLRH